MTYTTRRLGEELREQLQRCGDPMEIARWAFGVFLDERDAAPEANEVLTVLFAMEEGPEFEWSLLELEELAQQLIDGAEWRPSAREPRPGEGGKGA